MGSSVKTRPQDSRWGIMELRQREPRLVDPAYLRWLRKKPCCVCGKPAPSDAAHIRFGSEAYGKRNVGMAEKPDDRWAIPLCRECHTSQHSENEQEWWRRKRMLPLLLARKFYSEFGGTGGRQRTKRKPRQTIHPKGFGPKLRTRNAWPQGKRKIQNRGFSASSPPRKSED